LIVVNSPTATRPRPTATKAPIAASKAPTAAGIVVISTSIGLPTAARPSNGNGGSGGSNSGNGANGGNFVYGTVTAIAGTIIPTPAYYYYPIDGGNNGGGIYRSGGLLLVTIPPGGPGQQYAVNPQNGQVASYTGDGKFYLNGQPFIQSPNSKYGQGNFHITLLHWSADGRFLAFRVETPNAQSGTLNFNDTINDGLWVYDLAQNTSHQVFRNQYRDGQPIQIVYDFEWAADSHTLLVWVTPTRQSAPLFVDSGAVINLQP
jgi:hypothetical protein